MPCNTIQRTEIDLSKARSDLLKAALEAQGFSVTANAGHLQGTKPGITAAWSPGENLRITSRRGMYDAASITQEYSRQVVLYGAKKMGWKVRAINETQMTVRR